MDPVTAIGLAASVLQIGAACVKTIHSLDQLKRKYSTAPNSIDALQSEVVIIKASLLHIQELFQPNTNTQAVLHAKPELSLALDSALAGCKLVFDCLDKDIETFLPSTNSSTDRFGLRRRTSFLLKHDTFKGYLAQIHGHQNALSLLIQGLQMQSLSDINGLLQATNAKLTEIAEARSQLTILSSAETLYSESEPDLDDKAIDKAIEGKAQWAPAQGVVSENLIDLDVSDSIHTIVPRRSPGLEDLKELMAPTAEPTSKASSTREKLEANPLEKRDSAQSVVDRTPSIKLNMTTAISILGDPPSPMSAAPYFDAAPYLDDHARSASNHSTMIPRGSVHAMQSEFPEVAAQDAPPDPFPTVVNRPNWVPMLANEEQAALLAQREESRDTGSLMHLEWAEQVLHHCRAASRRRARLSHTMGNVEASHTETVLKADATAIVEAEAELSNPKALCLKATYFDLEEPVAQQLFSESSAKGYARAAYYVGRVYEGSKAKRETALGHYNKGASAGDSASLYRLAESFLKGELGNKKDHKQAIQLLRQAARSADRDFPLAHHRLAELQTPTYRKSFKLKESILPVDENAARESYIQAALLGCPASALVLGIAHGAGTLGCRRHPGVALHYLRLAAWQGESEADLEISNWFWFGADGVVDADHTAAFRHARIAAGDGYVPAFAQVGFFYEKGIGVPVNVERAKSWYLRGAGRDELCAKRLDNLRKRTQFGVRS
ncbi:HCP-like protein [Trichodelitschia bisporula]|uniref:HCP-like protein n=1 Tax=Trichodelitschia bisporula TaxID=703511 RepID=A0A6G1IA35_9PEZI|nr:HCP-like protein [Trichodelitschia bisporula]